MADGKETQTLTTAEVKALADDIARAPDNAIMEEPEEDFNFEAHGKKVRFASTSFGMTADNPVRKMFARIVLHPLFDRVILVCIIVNSLFLALVDNQNLDKNGENTSEGSPRNKLIEVSDEVFNAIFLVECISKVTAMGFMFGKGAYLKDGWNKLDFLIVLTSILTWAQRAHNPNSGSSGFGMLRVFRVLRPLRSVSSMPGLKVLIGGLLESIPSLMNVVVMMLFVFGTLSILCMQMYAGVLHNRCRATPYPLRLGDIPGQNFTNKLPADLPGRDVSEQKSLLKGAIEVIQQCGQSNTADPFGKECSKNLKANGFAWCLTNSDGLPVANNGRPTQWTQGSTPWASKQPCLWPNADPEDGRVCWDKDGDAFGGRYACNPDASGYYAKFQDKIPESGTWETQVIRSWCGSNYDHFMNPRFQDEENVMESFLYGLFTEDLNWGLTSFDNIARSFLTVFQVVTGEGWTDIMYQLQDSHHGFTAAFIFTVIILVGSWVMLNLLLAVLCSFLDADDLQEQEEAEFEEKVNETAKKQFEARVDQENKLRASGKTKEEIQSILQKTDEENLEKLEKLEEEHIHRHDDDGAEDEIVENSIANPNNPLFVLVTNKYFNAFIIFLIILNTIVLMIDHHGIEKDLQTNLEIINFVLSILFTVEMVLKLGGLGFDNYRRDVFNQFDAVVVICSWIEFATQVPDFITGNESAASSGGALSALRTFRVFRVFKLARDWESLRILLGTIYLTLFDVGNFAVLLFLFLYIFTLLGMQIFANKFRFDPDTHKKVPFDACFLDAEYQVQNTEGYSCSYYDAEVPRNNFDDFLWGLTTIFQVLSGENWNTVMYDGWRAAGTPAIFYFIALVILGDWIVMNLFLAILLARFEGNEDLAAKPKAPQEDEKLSYLQRFVNLIRRKKPQKIAPISNSEPVDLPSPVSDGAETTPDDRPVPPVPFEMLSKSMYLLSPENPFRKFCWKLMKKPAFDNTVLVLIVISSMCLAIENPLMDPNDPVVAIIKGLDVVMLILFDIEALVKIIAMGFLWSSEPKRDKTGKIVAKEMAYLQDPWNVLDFIIVVVSNFTAIAEVVGGSAALKPLRGLRTLRVLRPLRMINRAPGLKLVINALFRSIPGIINVIIVCLLFFLIFAIIGVSFFKGLFRQCSAPDDGWDRWSLNMLQYPLSFKELQSALQTEHSWKYTGVNATFTGVDGCMEAYAEKYMHQAPTSKWLCLNCFEQSWQIYTNQRFDNVALAYLGLFELTTTEGWVDIMYAAVDSNGVDMEPVRDIGDSFWPILFYILWIVIGSFFVMNLFVGVVIDNFNRMQDELGDSVFLTDEQKEWARTTEIMLRIRPQRKTAAPDHPFRKWCWEFCNVPIFDQFIMGCILANTVVMMLKGVDNSQAFTDSLEIINYMFAIIFTLEAVLKITALDWQYFKDNWNVFDFVIVVGTLVGLVIKWVTGASAGSIATVIRTFRIGRIFRLINSAKGLRQLFNTLIITLPGLCNVAAVLMLLFFIFAILFVQIFAKVAKNDDIHDNAHFQDFWNALMMLFRASTGENWNGLMYAMGNSPWLFDQETDAIPCTADPEFHPNVCDFGDSWKAENGVGKPQCMFEYPEEKGGALYNRTEHLEWAKEADCCIPIDGCGDYASSVFLWVVFTMVITYVKLNVVIGVILDGFGEAGEDEDAVLSETDFKVFTEKWLEFDPDATLYIKNNQLHDLIQQLAPPMGFGPEYCASTKELEKKIAELDLVISTNDKNEPVVHFKALSMALARRVYIEETPEDYTFEELPDSHKIAKQWGKKYKHKGKLDNAPAFGIETYYAAKSVQKSYLSYKMRRDMANRVTDKQRTHNQGSTAAQQAAQDA